MVFGREKMSSGMFCSLICSFVALECCCCCGCCCSCCHSSPSKPVQSDRVSATAQEVIRQPQSQPDLYSKGALNYGINARRIEVDKSLSMDPLEKKGLNSLTPVSSSKKIEQDIVVSQVKSVGQIVPAKAP